MLEVILFPVQVWSAGKGSFNLEEDICDWTCGGRRGKKTPHESCMQFLHIWLFHHVLHLAVGNEPWLTDSAASPVRGWGRRVPPCGREAAAADLWELETAVTDRSANTRRDASQRFPVSLDVTHGSGIWMRKRWGGKKKHDSLMTVNSLPGVVPSAVSFQNLN